MRRSTERSKHVAGFFSCFAIGRQIQFEARWRNAEMRRHVDTNFHHDSKTIPPHLAQVTELQWLRSSTTLAQSLRSVTSIAIRVPLLGRYWKVRSERYYA